MRLWKTSSLTPVKKPSKKSQKKFQKIIDIATHCAIIIIYTESKRNHLYKVALLCLNKKKLQVHILVLMLETNTGFFVIVIFPLLIFGSRKKASKSLHEKQVVTWGGGNMTLSGIYKWKLYYMGLDKTIHEKAQKIL